MCSILKISSRGYYKWKKRSISKKALKKNKLKQKIKTLYFEFKQRYGSPRITAELQALGYRISRVTVAKYMKELGLKSKLSKKFKVTTNSKHNYLIAENVLDRDFKATRSSQKWVSDITYIHTQLKI